MFTNLLLDENLLEEIIFKIPSLNWLINVCNNGNEDVFKRNLKLLARKSHTPLSLGIVFCQDERKNKYNIDKIIALIKENSNISVIRFSLLNVYKKYFQGLKPFSDPVLELCKKITEVNPSIIIASECFINFCNFSATAIAEMLEKYQVQNLYTSDFCRPILEVRPDKTVKYCHLVPDKFLTVKNYRDFSCSKECYDYLTKQLCEFMNKNNKLCDKNDNCNKAICTGPCPAICEYIRREKEGL